MKTKSLHSIFAILAAAAFLIPSCKVDDNFSADKIAETDLTMTLFENGLELPLIQGDTLRIDSLINRIPEDLKKYLKTDDNGYYILYDGSFEIKDLLSEVNLDELVSIDGVDIKDTAEFSMGSFNAADFAIEKTEFNQSVDLPDFASAIDMTIPDINQTINEKAGIYGGEYDITLTFSGTREVTSSILDKNTIVAAATAAEAASITEFNLGPMFESASPVSMQDIDIEGSFLPQNVSEVKDVVLKDGAAIKLKLSIENNIFDHGTIVPDIDVEYGDLMSLQGCGTSLNLSSFALNSSNGYSVTQTYYIEDINEAKLFDDKKISFSGELRVQDSPRALTSVAKAIADDMAIKIEVEFVNVEVDDFTCVISRIDIAPETTCIDLDIDPIDLPEEVSKVNTITFTDASAMDLFLSCVNKDCLPDLDLTLDEVRVEFPAGLTIHGEGISGNILTVPAGTSISEGITRKVYIDEMALDNSVAGKVGFSGQLKVDVKAHADGSFKGSQIKSLPGDVEVNGSVIGNIAIADFDVVLSTIEKSISYPAQSIDITGLDPAVGNFGTFVITPKQVGGKNPELQFEVNVPDLSAFPFALGDGIVISLPDLVRFETPLNPDLNYNETAHTVTITSLASHTYVLPIKELVVTPQKADDGTYFIHSSYGVEGGIKLQDAHVHKADIDALSGEKIELNAVIPALSAQSVSLDKLQLAIPAINYDLGELIKAEDIPEMLVRINELDFGDLALDLDVQTENLPDIGTGKFNVAVKAYLPDFISPKVIDINQDIVDGKFNIHQDVALDLSAYNFEKMRAEGSAITGTIKIEGTISAED
ncbi:MAG: hypothetical protein KBS55_04795, partial [Bacteroidales bacterium]|nr:hypothetical protein [Candidatus Cryptobacteroides aphodequi]